MHIDLNNHRNKLEVVTDLERYFKDQSLQVVEKNIDKPWGAYFKFAEQNGGTFKKLFFTDNNIKQLEQRGLKHEPKILLVAPGKRLSWQYHFRRSELWRVIDSKVGVILSETDQEPVDVPTYISGDLLTIPVGVRHRLIGLDTWGMVAEFWIHEDKTKPSDEVDIVRVADDFGR